MSAVSGDSRAHASVAVSPRAKGRLPDGGWPPPAIALLGISVLAIVYFFAARLGLSLAFEVEQITPVWPPTGIALAAVLLCGRWVWPGIALGAFAANMLADEPVATALCIAIGNTLEALAAAWLLRRVAGPGDPLRRVRGVLLFTLLAALTATTIAATIGTLSLFAGGVVEPWSRFGELWALWWLGDASGALVVAPVLLAWGDGTRPRWSVRRVAEAAALGAGLFAMCLLVFSGGPGSDQVGHVLAYALFPFVIWAALRFGRRGTTAVTLLASSLAIRGTVIGTGPFALGNPHLSLMLLQAFMAMVAITGLVLAAVIFERDRIESELRQSELSYSSLAEAVPGILFTNEADGACDYVSQAYYDYTGLAPGTAVGYGWTSALHLGDLERTRSRWEACVKEGRLYETEFRVRSREGSYAWFTSRSIPMRDDAGHVVKWFGVCVNIDRQKRDEAALQEADRRKDEFLAVLGHELRNPLAPIRHAAEILGAGDLQGRDAVQACEVIARQVGHMARLLDDLLDVARVTQGSIRLRPQRCDLADIVHETAEDFRPVLLGNGVQLDLELPGRPLWLTGDPTRLAQVVNNVLHNASKFTEPGGRVTVKLVPDAAHRQASLSVSDTGIGMDERTLSALFQAFNQADRSLAHSGGGLGLGLTLVKGLVALHGGETRAYSEGPGKGTRIEIVLPIDDEAPPPVPAEEPALAAHPRRVLIVEDSRDAAEGLRLLLQRAGHAVDVVHDGITGVEAARRLRPEVVLCDIGLPGLDGYAVARALRAMPEMAGTFLVAITGYGKDEDRHRARAAGFDVHLTKPVTFADLQGLLSSGHAPRGLRGASSGAPRDHGDARQAEAGA